MRFINITYTQTGRNKSRISSCTVQDLLIYTEARSRVILSQRQDRSSHSCHESRDRLRLADTMTAAGDNGVVISKKLTKLLACTVHVRTRRLMYSI